MLSPTVSGGDVAGPRFCAPLPPSPSSFPPHFLGIALKTLDEFPSKSIFFTLFFVREPSVKALGSLGGVGWELRRLH